MWLQFHLVSNLIKQIDLILSKNIERNYSTVWLISQEKITRKDMSVQSTFINFIIFSCWLQSSSLDLLLSADSITGMELNWKSNTVLVELNIKCIETWIVLTVWYCVERATNYWVCELYFSNSILFLILIMR